MPKYERGIGPQPAIVETPVVPSPRAKPGEPIAHVQTIPLERTTNAIKRNAELFAQSAQQKPELRERASHWESQARELQAEGYSLDEIIVFFGQNMAHSEALAEKDPLTELFSRNGIERRFGEAIAHSDRTKKDKSDRKKGKISLAIIDLDNFKNINDTYGHPTGDKVLSATGKFLQKDVRRTTTVGRHGGEEFIFILPETDLPQAVEVLERKRTAFSKAVRHDSGIDRKITISSGIVTYDPEAYEKQFGSRNQQIKSILTEQHIVIGALNPEEREQCLKNAEAERTRRIFEYCTEKADKALYAAKRRGRNRVMAIVPDEPNDDLFVDMRDRSVYVENERNLNGEPVIVYSKVRT